MNPAHLFLGTAADNTLDMMAKGRKVPARGERHASAKLTANDVLKIRAAYEDGVGPTPLSKQFGVHLDTVWDVISRRTWRHVKPAEQAR